MSKIDLTAYVSWCIPGSKDVRVGNPNEALMISLYDGDIIYCIMEVCRPFPFI